MVEHFQDIGDRTRAALADLIDLQMSPLGLAAMDALGPIPGQTIVDVGCGAGQTVLQLAERVGHAGSVIGVDVAPRVLAVARIRTAHLPRVSLLQGDAAQMSWPRCSVDAVYSRFGVMFFADPVQAFGNLGRMLRPDGRIGFATWRSMRENELDFVPTDAAGLKSASEAAHFSFERPCFIEEVLRGAGFDLIDIKPFDADVSRGDVEATLKVVTQVGALGKLLREAPNLRAAVEPQVRAALAKRESDGQVCLKAATWIVTASMARR